MQTTAQKYTTPTHIGLIFSLEPVFAALFAFAFAGELFSVKGYIGASMVLLGVITAEIDVKSLLMKGNAAKRIKFIARQEERKA